MTLNAFYQALEQALTQDEVARPTYLEGGAMRLYLGGRFSFCPITYVALRQGKGSFDTSNVEDAAAALGLPSRTRARLVRAADNLSQSQTRQRLETLWKKGD